MIGLCHIRVFRVLRVRLSLGLSIKWLTKGVAWGMGAEGASPNAAPA